MDTPDFLGNDPRLAAFNEGVDSAERLLATDQAASAVRSRSVMEQIIRWIYEVDGSLRQPPENTLTELLHSAGFRQILRSEVGLGAKRPTTGCTGLLPCKLSADSPSSKER